MPAIDYCEPQVIRALNRGGYRVTDQSFALRIDITRGFVFADLRLVRTTEPLSSIIVVEVKCFPETRTALDELYGAIGQYIVYREAMLFNAVEGTLFLAVPMTVFETLLKRPVLDAAIRETKINLIVVDLEHEEVRQWIRW
ncbi:MAG: hypothetical protein IPM16_17525 [Chloroflexi bacterium]|nr:hypothetical protein [Chloroflexota bacterium]